MAKHLDALGTIFPFEVDCYSDTELPVQFVGHPFVSEEAILPVRYDPEGKLLLLPGSRKAVVSRLFPVLVETYYLLKQTNPSLQASVMYPTPKLKALLESIIVDMGHRLEEFELLPNSDKFSARAVITNSGTISLVCALAAIPGLLVYKTNSLTYWIAKLLVKIQRIGIANIILDELIHPEYLQSNMRPEILKEEVEKILQDSGYLERTQKLSDKLSDQLRVPSKQNATQWMLEQLEAQY
jgi:lipid-A-disaccharide synthase